MTEEGKQQRYGRREDVVRRILQREMDGLSLRMTDVKVKERLLHVAAVEYFQTWRKALRAAGIDPDSVSGIRSWSKGTIIRRIRELEREGVPLNTRSIWRVDSGLISVARRHWGSWDAALVAAGFDPKTIRRLRPKWTRETLIKAIQTHAASGGRVTWNAMKPRSIGVASRRIFGSFNAALEAAGVLHKRNPHPRWSRAEVQAAIYDRQQKGEPLNCAAVIKAEPCIYDAARRYCGGWEEALRLAGIDPDGARAIRREWTCDGVIEELRRRVAAGVPPTCVSSIRPIPLVTACRKLFGSCEAAAVAAGVDPTKIGYVRSRKNGLHRSMKRGSRDAPSR